MTLFDFQLFAQREQLDLLYQQGVYIGKQKKIDTVALLYQLDSFYVEIYYRKYRCHVLALRCFTAMEKLDPYLDQVPVDNLVNI